jgi:NitT/TauT family transport system substrate-binding protein
MTRFTTKPHSVLCGLLAIGMLATLQLGCKPTENPPGSREKVTIAYSTASNAILAYIAFAKGFFTEEGLDAVPQPHAFGKLALNSVIEGKADIATAADTPIVFAIMNGKKITTLAVIQTSNRDNAIVARKDRGIAKPADLKGKKIGVPMGTSAEFFLYTVLLASGIESNQVTLVAMKPDQMAEAFEKGTIDAVAAFNPTIKHLEKKLSKRGTVFHEEALYTETFCIVAMQEYAQKNPEAVKKVLRAFIKAQTFVQQHDQEARALVADFIKLDRAALDEIWDIFTFKVTLDQALLVNFEDQTRWLLKSGSTSRKSMPNYLEYIYADGLYFVKPEAVRIVR